MRILVVHNQYRSSMPSGENRVVEQEIAALRKAGHEVATYLRSSDEIETMNFAARLRLATGPILGGRALVDVERLVTEFRPDVIHLHNPYPLISPGVVTVANRLGVPSVATVHNFRLRCMSGLFFRDGAICTECENRRLGLPGVIHGCYRGSRAESAVMAAALFRHRPTWSGVQRFIAVSGFVKEWLEHVGIPPDRVTVKANAAVDPGPVSPPGTGFLFAGRLSPEKGLRLLMDAWSLSGLDGYLPLYIAGDGELRGEIDRWAAGMRSVRVLGLLDEHSLAEARRSTAASITCSTWFEAHSSVGESFAAARPVVAIRIGALATIVDASVGWLAEPNPTELAAAFVAATDSVELEARSRAARERWAYVYSPEVVLRQLEDVYRSVVGGPHPTIEDH